MKPNTEPDFFKANLALLKEHHPKAWEMVTSNSSSPTGEIVRSADDNPNLRVKRTDGKDILLHDQKTPLAEGPQYLQLVPEESIGTVVMLGMGLGYGALQLVQERKNFQHLILFELHPGIFLQALKCLDLSTLISDPRLILSVSPDPDIERVLKPASRTLQLENIHQVRHQPAFTAFPAEYSELREKVFEQINQLNISGSTTTKFGEKFLTNRFKNIPAVTNSNLLEQLHNAFEGVPALIIAGGPSLDKNVQLVGEAKGRAVVIAADTVLPVLQSNGVTPDFFTSIDSQELTYEKIAEAAADIGPTSLVTLPWVSPKVPHNFPTENIFWGFGHAPIEKWMLNGLGGTMLSGQAGTVAHLSFNLAVELGCSPIIFVGQDLAFTDDRDHAANVSLTNGEKIKKSLKTNKDMVQVEGINGGKVRTNRVLYGYKQWFEMMIRSHQDRLFINATEGGAHIQGTTPLSLQEALKKYCREDLEITGTINDCAKGEEKDFSNRIIKLFNKKLDEVSSLQKLLADAAQKTLKAKRGIVNLSRKKQKPSSFKTLPPGIRKSIAKVDKLQAEVDKADNIWGLLQEVTIAGLKESERMKHSIARLSQKKDYLKWVQKNLERLELINQVRKESLTNLEKILADVVSFLSQKEKLLSLYQKNPQDQDTILSLARLYNEWGDLRGAEEFFEKALKLESQVAEALYYKGKLLILNAQFEEAETLFEQASKIDPGYGKKIESFRLRLGAKYLAYAQSYRDIDRRTMLQMLIKGLRCCTRHNSIREEIKGMAAEDLATIKDALEKEDENLAESLIEAWKRNINNHREIAECLSPDQKTLLQAYHAKQLVAQGKSEKAIRILNEAKKSITDNADLEIMLVEAYFAQGDFAEGIKHLHNAVKLNKDYAGYWEEIGDGLYAANNPDDALAAYEQGFLSMPEQFDLLKKIGDCYMELKQPEAAHEAYRRFKNALLKNAV